MDQLQIILFLGGLLALTIWLLVKQVQKVAELQSKLKSSYVQRGTKIESIAPFKFMQDYPEFFEDEGFSYFMWLGGKPFDFLGISKNGIKFIEFKTGQAGLNDNEKMLKSLIESHQIGFEVVRV